MRIARISTADGPRHVVQDGDAWHGIADPFTGWAGDPFVGSAGGPTGGSPLTEPARTGESWPVAGATLLSPVVPTVVFGMAHNGGPADRELPPQAFQKSARTVAGPGDAIGLDPSLGTVNVEGELAVVIGRTSRFLTADDVPGAILGYTIANDVTAVDQIPSDHLLTQVKNGDAFTPIGPWIETEFDPSDAHILVRVGPAGSEDGDLPIVADATTASLAWDVTEQLVYLTSFLTLGPGDIVLTGSPATFAPIVAGERAVITIDGIGTLTNPTAVAGRPTVLVSAAPESSTGVTA
ncbi:fumarylacetoacetate hydrolase family protein [Plantibacter sp. YIM 135347]|uniref:fumarylacetoacetate hydrolase family protein n=1 Tax=Plantibacter sp. YIM 135347 TaxID=3423919 RepID=UPI003D32E422